MLTVLFSRNIACDEDRVGKPPQESNPAFCADWGRSAHPTQPLISPRVGGRSEGGTLPFFPPTVKQQNETKKEHNSSTVGAQIFFKATRHFYGFQKVYAVL